MFHWDLALIVAFLGTAVPWMGRRRVQQLLRVPQTSTVERLTLYASTMAFQWLIAAVILWRVTAERIAIQRLGVQLPHALLTGTVAAGLSALIFANQMYSVRRIGAAKVDERNILIQLALKIFPQNVTERLAFFAVVVTVALCEEWIYRGFVQLMFQSWARSAVAGIVGSAVLFAGAHVYQGRRGIVSTFSVGLIFSVVRFWTGSLVPSVAAHFVADLTTGYLAPHFVMAAIRNRSVSDGTINGRL